jgi:hypothetical protein
MVDIAFDVLRAAVVLAIAWVVVRGLIGGEREESD